MKKINGIVIASLMFCNIGFAEIRLIESQMIKERNSSDYIVSTLCIDGKKFVLARTQVSDSLSIVQVFKKPMVPTSKHSFLVESCK